jgi:hypothetical protein
MDGQAVATTTSDESTTHQENEDDEKKKRGARWCQGRKCRIFTQSLNMIGCFGCAFMCFVIAAILIQNAASINRIISNAAGSIGVVSNALTTFQNNGQLSIVIPMTPAPRP